MFVPQGFGMKYVYNLCDVLLPIETQRHCYSVCDLTASLGKGLLICDDSVTVLCSGLPRCDISYLPVPYSCCVSTCAGG